MSLTPDPVVFEGLRKGKTKRAGDANRNEGPPLFIEPLTAEQKRRAWGIVSIVRRSDIDVIFIVDASGMHQTSHLPLVFVQFFIVIVHGSLSLLWNLCCVSIQVLPKSGHALAAEYAEDVALLLREFLWSFPAERGEVPFQKGWNAS